LKVAYVDSSLIVRYFLPNDPGSAEVAVLFADPDTALVTGTLTRIEVSGALVRAARNQRTSPKELLDRFDYELESGLFTLVGADRDDTEQLALDLVRSYGIRALDAIHVATAKLTLPELVASADTALFLSRDAEQAAVAAKVGLATG
jgi:uncharacterized protein